MICVTEACDICGERCTLVDERWVAMGGGWRWAVGVDGRWAMMGGGRCWAAGGDRRRVAMGGGGIWNDTR